MTWEKFGKGAFGLLFLIVGIVLKGWALTVLWGWFVTPNYGIPVPHIAVAIGLALLVRYTIIGVDAPKEKEEPFWLRWLLAVVSPFFVLGVGWIVLQFVPHIPA